MKFLNTVTARSARPDHILSLQKGVIVILLRNMFPFRVHVHGSRYVFSEKKTNTLNSALSTGAKAGSKMCLSRMPYGPGEESFSMQGFLVTQFPVRVCLRITINKAQVQSSGVALRVDLQEPVFSHGQLYVGLFRATRPKNLCIICPTFPLTQNIVF